MLSGDQNIVDVRFSVAYRISDPQAHVQSFGSDSTLRQIAESAMREVVGSRPAQDIFRDDRQGIARDVREIMQQTIDDYGAGLAITAISIEMQRRLAKLPMRLKKFSVPSRTKIASSKSPTSIPTRSLARHAVKALRIREEAAAYKNRVVRSRVRRSASSPFTMSTRRLPM